ncbi:PREDICTED: zeta-carotene desaturase, chloroplastic/chromoplastic-like [Prunus mume]|uniref:Zeta-carotene desaturase, chloroplastic/chromoplastic-like n=1 Tax=Prunus mume TaxID=102107 RepID=A0ABM0NWT2_PRUMU|nr:PREDICTED: zeta-carotene desaturase, chloroplastic/chromoplastic-like [Prunus mume]
MASWVLLPVAPVTGRCLLAPVRTQRSSSICIRSFLDTNVSDMSVRAPKGLFPPESEHYRGPKLKVAIIGAGLAGMSIAFELLDQGHEVGPIYVLVPRLLTILSELWIYMSQGLSLVEKWDPMLINVETTLKWDSMFSLVATAIFSD